MTEPTVETFDMLARSLGFRVKPGGVSTITYNVDTDKEEELAVSPVMSLQRANLLWRTLEESFHAYQNMARALAKANETAMSYKQQRDALQLKVDQVATEINQNAYKARDSLGNPYESDVPRHDPYPTSDGGA